MKDKNIPIIITSIIAGVILIIALFALISFNRVVGPSSEDTVHVEGMATIKAMPDLIGIYFNVETKGNTSAEASQANAVIVDGLISGLIALGFERKEIVTENFNVYQDYDWEDDKRVEKGYKATHSVSIKVSLNESVKIMEILDVGTNAGAGVSYINYELTQESQNIYKAEAMKLAARDAKIKADSVAEGFDKEVGKLVSVSVSDFGYQPWRAYGGGVSEDVVQSKDISINIQPKEQEVSARVQATYKLE